MATLQNLGVLKYRDKDGNWKPLPVVLQSSGGGGSGGISTISGKGQPTESTVGRLNQLYRDEDTQRLYICTATDGGYTWAAVSGGSVDVDETLTRAGYAADAKAAGDAIGKKIGKAQGVENAGMILGVDEDGNVVPQDKPVQALAGTDAPTAATAGVVGQEYYVIVDNAVTEMYVCTSALIGSYTWNKVEFGGGTSNAVQYTEQSLTDTQKQQARTNIGAGTSSFSGSYNDLTNTPVLDTTLEQSGKPADAKAVGDAIGSAIETTTTILGASKVDKSQGTENAGKILGIGASGIVTPVDKPVYTLPIATPTVLGGVKPMAKTTAMTQDVGVSDDGKLYTAPSGGGTDNSLGITSATVGQIAKITAVDSAGKPTGWEPVDMSEGDSGGLRNIDLIVDHIVTTEEVTAIRLTWDTTTIPELGKYNLFYAVISSQTNFSFDKWVRFYINNGAVAQFSGSSSPKVKKLPISVNRYFGRWVGTSVYNPDDRSVFPLIAGENEMNLNENANNANADATSIGIGSYAIEFGLTEGMSIKIYAMV